MKKKLLAIFIIFYTVFTSAFTQEVEEDPTRPVIDLPELKLLFDEGVSYCQVTRIEKLDNRSNFVRENMMIGGYFNVQTVDLSFFDFIFDVSAYYPFYNAFNGMQQKTKNIFNYGISSFFGTTITYTNLKYVDITASLGMHYMYQLTDEYHMHYVGLGGILGLVLPITEKWAIVNNNFVSYDNPNLGSNKNMQPFDGAYQYHIDLGMRYSKRVPNKYYYIDTSKIAEKKAQKKAEKELKKQDE